MSEQQQSESPSLSEVVSQLRRGKQLSDGVGEQISKRYLFAGKTMDQWRQEFAIEIPPDPSPNQVRQLLAEVADKYQEANSYKALAEAKYKTLSIGYNKASCGAMVQKRAEALAAGGRAPGKEVLEALAAQQENVQELAAALTNSDIETSFWKSVISSLDVCRDVLKTASIVLGIEAKVLQFQGESNSGRSNGSDF